MEKKTPSLSNVIYVLGGILIVLAAIKVIYSGCQYVKDYLQQKNHD